MVSRLQANGFVAFYAGGCVRDMLRGVEPNDYDIATDALPRNIEELFEQTYGVGKQFGVMVVRLDGHDFEVATFREEKAYRDGRRPEAVSFTDPRHDAKRRDFTINAMFYDPIRDRLHDYTGGRQDLRNRIIRCVGDPVQRFGEDHLRMLRAVRFASVLQYDLDRRTAEAIAKNSALITKVSRERIAQELTRILTESPTAGQAVRNMDRLNLLAHILPEIEDMKGQEQPPRFHPEGDVFTHTVLMLDMMKDYSPVLAYAVLLHDVAKPRTAKQGADRIRFDGHAGASADMAADILRRLRFSNELVMAVYHCIRNHMRFMDVQRMKRSTLLKLVSSPLYEDELELHRLDCMASHGDLANYYFLRDFENTVEPQTGLPPAWITGHDIMQMGIPEGPEVGYWRSRAYDAQLEGRFSDRNELLTWLRGQIETTD